jgi:hypothetical protein
VKLGRPSALPKVTAYPIGVRITEEIDEKFKRGIDKFYEKSDRKDLTEAYDRTLETFFRKRIDLIKGIPTPILPPAEQLPTFRQFQYWYETYYRDFRREKKAREGEKEYNLSGRPLFGDSTQMAFGPGSLYQIDATIADIYLVNSFDESRIIGRPIIYACVDVFSRMVTGICVTLEGPSWLGAMLALDNVVADKVAFCAEYGITIEKDEWPCYRLPNAILADRGEFEGYDADSLPNSLGVRIHNTGPYRADWKGIVERHFGIVNEKFIHFTPGAVPRPWKRGDPDYALKAVHTLDAFRKMLIYHVIHYNNYHYLKTYKKSEYMIADDVDRYPMDFWNWGIRKRNGHLEPLPQEIVRLNLLPRKEVSVTPTGIHFEKELFYRCNYADDRGWFDKARIRGNWKIEISYDPRRVDHIYLPLDNRTRLERCDLIPASKAYLGRDWHDAKDYFEYEMRKEESSRTRRQRSKSVFHAQIDQVNAESMKKAKAARARKGKQSKSALKQGINPNRAVEKEIEREKNAWQLGTENTDKTSSKTKLTLVSDVPVPDKEEYVPPSPKADRLRVLRDKEWKKDEK